MYSYSYKKFRSFFVLLVCFAHYNYWWTLYGSKWPFVTSGCSSPNWCMPMACRWWWCWYARAGCIWCIGIASFKEVKLRSFFHFILRFWNQILICRSVTHRACAISIRRRRVRYRLKWNSFSNSRVWYRVYDVRPRFFTPFSSTFASAKEIW